jgi:S-formylglutathione hydrolase FrmB
MTSEKYCIHKKESDMREWLRVSLLGVMVLTSCSSREGTLIVRTIDARSLARNRMGIAERQQLAIYLPPSYREGQRRYPVLYWLPNFTACLWRYTGGDYQRFHLRQTMDELIAKGAAREMIVVIPNAVHMLGGSCFRNSPLTGNWEDYIVKDVVGYMDSQYRTIRSAGARGLTGHGMGGTGALEIGLKHPDLFSGVYAMSPALFDTNGLRDAGMLSDRQLEKWQARLAEWRGLDEAARRKGFRDYIQSRLNSPSRDRSLEGLYVAYAAAVSPDLSLPYPHIAFPAPGALSRPGTPLIARFENGFGGWPEKVSQYLARGGGLSAITIEYGKEDDYQWIRHGCDYVSQLMRGMGVANELVLHAGGHESTLGRRLETAMLPSISKMLRDSP